MTEVMPVRKCRIRTKILPEWPPYPVKRRFPDVLDQFCRPLPWNSLRMLSLTGSRALASDFARLPAPADLAPSDMESVSSASAAEHALFFLGTPSPPLFTLFTFIISMWRKTSEWTKGINGKEGTRKRAKDHPEEKRKKGHGTSGGIKGCGRGEGWIVRKRSGIFPGMWKKRGHGASGGMKG